MDHPGIQFFHKNYFLGFSGCQVLAMTVNCNISIFRAECSAHRDHEFQPCLWNWMLELHEVLGMGEKVLLQQLEAVV